MKAIICVGFHSKRHQIIYKGQLSGLSIKIINCI